MARMDTVADIARFRNRLGSVAPDKWSQQRCLAFFSAAIAIADEKLIGETIALVQSHKVERQAIYEVVLQSYLFLGFPRMLSAATLLHRDWPTTNSPLSQTFPPTEVESKAWFDNGLALCQQVYGNAFEPLREKVEEVAPEIFRWMIIEGYGKVLSREGLPLGERELCIMALLIIENRVEQLHSHLRGAIRTGVDPELIRIVIDDIGPTLGGGYDFATELLSGGGAEG